MPRLIDDARHVWHRFWSVRLSLIAAALGAVDAALPLIAPEGRGLRFALVTAGVSLAAAVARLVSQPKLHKEQDDA